MVAERGGTPPHFAVCVPLRPGCEFVAEPRYAFDVAAA